MNTGLPMILVSAVRYLLGSQSYAQRALSALTRFGSAMQVWARAAGALTPSALIVTGAATGAALTMLVGVLSLRIRARRERGILRQELDRQIARAEAAESANAAKSDFLASMSHQIRTPLNVIVGFTELALKTELEPQLRESLDAVRTSADRLMHTVNDIEEFSAIQAGTLQLENVAFSISECIQSAMKTVQHEAAAKKLLTASSIDPALPPVVCGDPMRLRHVLYTLLDNAVRFTTSGSVMLSAVLESDGADDVLVRVEVTDTGIGIPPAKQPLVFEPFRQVDESATLKWRANVLGLPISRRLVELMGGTIAFQSQLGAGSRFGFTARFQKQKIAEIQAPNPAHESAPAQELSILVAEDDAVSRRLVTKVLESAGHRVWTAANGEEALHCVQTEAFDLIFMDIEMPDLNGLEATRAIRNGEAPGLRVPIYALTAHSTSADRETCIAAGMDGFLTKPISVDEVLQLVSKLAASAGSRSIGLTEPAGNAAGDSGADLESLAIALRETTDDSTASELDLQAIWKNPADFQLPAEQAAETSPDQETDRAFAEGILEHAEAPNNDRSVDLCPTGCAPQAEQFSDAIGSDVPLSVSLQLLETGCQSTWLGPSLDKPDDAPTPPVWDPFEQARKALSNSRFDVRVIHSNGDPSERNLI